MLADLGRHVLRDLKYLRSPKSRQCHCPTKRAHLYSIWLKLEKQKDQDPINNFKEWDLGKRALWAANDKAVKLSVLAFAQFTKRPKGQPVNDPNRNNKCMKSASRGAW